MEIMGKDLIFETKYWKIILSDDQTYLGRCSAVLKRKCGDLAEVAEDEMLDFLNLIKIFESKVRHVFGAKMFNWTCLMNGAYQKTPPDPQVHFHVRPRYDKEIVFISEKFIDTDFGHHYIRGTYRILSPDIREKIIEAIKNAKT